MEVATEVDARTPTQREMDSRDWTFEEHGRTSRGSSDRRGRLHYVDEGPGDGQPVVMLHGNPTWSYLYRNFIPALTDAGFRTIVYDEMGFGRSDKPHREAEYSLERHVRQFTALADELSLDGVTLVLQDWGDRSAFPGPSITPGRCAGSSSSTRSRAGSRTA